LFSKKWRCIYEGQWEDGERNGQGIEYYDDLGSKKKYVGGWGNGKYHGKGIGYYYNGNIKYKGRWKYG
jgi:hypothetical protein